MVLPLPPGRPPGAAGPTSVRAVVRAQQAGVWVLAGTWAVVPVGTVSSAAAPGTLRSQRGQGQPAGCELQSRSLSRGCWGWRTGPCPPRSPVALSSGQQCCVCLCLLPEASPGAHTLPGQRRPYWLRAAHSADSLFQEPVRSSLQGAQAGGVSAALGAETAPQHSHGEACEVAESGSLLAVLVAPGSWPRGPRGTALAVGEDGVRCPRSQ